MCVPRQVGTLNLKILLFRQLNAWYACYRVWDED